MLYLMVALPISAGQLICMPILQVATLWGLSAIMKRRGLEFGRDNSGKITAAADSALKINAEATSGRAVGIMANAGGDITVNGDLTVNAKPMVMLMVFGLKKAMILCGWQIREAGQT